MNLYLNFSEPRGIQLKVQCRDPTYVPISKTTRVDNNLGQSHQTPTLTRHFCNLFGLLRNEICRKRKGRRRCSARVNNPYRKSREMVVIIWLYSATLSQISWNIMGLFFHRAVFYALWSWPLFGIAIALLEMLDTSTLTSSTLKITKYSNLCNFLLICLFAIILCQKQIFLFSILPWNK